MRLGFTGTRAGMSAAQLRVVEKVLYVVPSGAVHGGAEGADEEFDELLTAIYDLLPDGWIRVYPASEQRRRHWRTEARRRAYRDVEGVLEPLSRNRLIVVQCDKLLACPGQQEEIVRSGTWATVRCARRLARPLMLVLLDGAVKMEGGW